MSAVDENELSVCVKKVLTQYFKDLDGEIAANVHEMVMNCVERPLLRIVLDKAGNNQSRAADILGINRNTLRKKMLQHGIK
ncbi:MAG: Fis family transcriptional regulator [Hydrogenophilales bacterium CG03_land_8_20_14_0_80_62_28]|nr:Fis family transcriptional regulator [Betaproteobacteria bacterium]OIO77848.1 MAG: Fis family transcriptional regulator [Hydrogenophilaceae bacterium CG1_02_62_390]PIV23748.1 MAG: Fis family transcriptional regulator [Hydrogenophilales bacterium CG03_land_8_20_14_0_80_62_28]PIW38145.1 MAG: Fis family transcriptional regulator [Hydrogenophilales bacterium CG15_BIG_FIL_POST_REV_8_21_14_020_62_31]PIW71071.1 MAG: Fis family transcriptional regulator [Hydrogenophilales bacterium CG12_big_fil_rev_